MASAAAATNTGPQVSTKSPTIRRILREAAEISNSPSADYTAEPLETDLFEWHFTLRGPPKSVYSQGLYHGRIVLPPTYPLRPPSFRFTTPNGRFEANREICLSISGHHEETWQPAWGIRTALVALRSFMETDARGQLGGIDTTEAVRHRLARESASFRCQMCARSNATIIADAEQRARENSNDSADIQIPRELSIAWRDEMKPIAGKLTHMAQTDFGDDASSSAQTRGRNDRNHKELAKDLGKTSSESHISSDSVEKSVSHVPARRAQRQQQSASTMLQQDGVPLWVDRAIVALIILLAALLLKVLFGV
ncbi:hypothetical protein CDD83_1076 [Cordyceps sp. RAO-2017]|nr:hypothetical protein CDD83_1076 [Cordyceps sp. RAO-2017]